MKRYRLLRPDFIVAMLAVIIGVCTMFVYVYQARVMTKQMHATTWPFLETIFYIGTTELSVTVKNKGVGPAVVKNMFIIVDGERFADSRQNVDSVVFKMTGSGKILNGYTTVNNRVISAGEEIKFIEVTDSLAIRLLKTSLALHSIKFEICYCSVLGDCWQLMDAKTNECENCD